MENKFYVYEHYKKGTDECFYVGKGTGRRAHANGHRNKHWTNVVNKHGYYVEYVQLDMSESDAFKLEIELIKEYGLSNLTNITLGGSGGDTITNNPNRDDIVKNMSKAKKGVKKSDEHRENIRLSKIGNKHGLGTVHTPEERKRISCRMKGNTNGCGKRPVVKCPYCGKSGGDTTMKRWHFDNCKHFKNKNKNE